MTWVDVHDPPATGTSGGRSPVDEVALRARLDLVGWHADFDANSKSALSFDLDGRRCFLLPMGGGAPRPGAGVAGAGSGAEDPVIGGSARREAPRGRPAPTPAVSLAKPARRSASRVGRHVHDLVIANDACDGLGTPAREGASRQDRPESPPSETTSARRDRVDGAGLVLGARHQIDLHTHYDAQLTWTRLRRRRRPSRPPPVGLATAASRSRPAGRPPRTYHPQSDARGGDAPPSASGGHRLGLRDLPGILWSRSSGGGWSRT